ncbi:MAG: transglutaminase-like domain-containing protein [Lachnospiraceae bacterium]|nr:transglutaminase-like domain-containing protein [Lachnospiraceae bacterium]
MAAGICLLLLVGCGSSRAEAKTSPESQASSSGSSSWQPRENASEIPMPEASGEKTCQSSDGSITLDISHTEEGYVMAKATSGQKIQVQITNPDGGMFPYPMEGDGQYKTFPLTCGDGDYSIRILVNLSGDQYAVGFSQDFSVALKDEFQPFLYPNQYVAYTPESRTAALGEKMAASAKSDLDYVRQVYEYVTKNISYDTELADSIPVDYLPDPDKTLSEGKGICFDYASLMTALLRSQGVPTKLVTGYSGDAYHAWVSVYLESRGWVDNIIYFDGKNWTLMDPTLGANNDAKAVKKYVGDGSNYTVKYIY